MITAISAFHCVLETSRITIATADCMQCECGLQWITMWIIALWRLKYNILHTKVVKILITLIFLCYTFLASSVCNAPSIIELLLAATTQYPPVCLTLNACCHCLPPCFRVSRDWIPPPPAPTADEAPHADVTLHHLAPPVLLIIQRVSLPAPQTDRRLQRERLAQTGRRLTLQSQVSPLRPQPIGAHCVFVSTNQR